MYSFLLQSVLLILTVLDTVLTHTHDAIHFPGSSSRRQTEPFQYSYKYQKTTPSPHSPYKELIKVYEAQNVEFGFPSESERLRALRSGDYNPDTPIPIDVDVYYPPRGGSARVFITVPRFGKGVPYSLAYLTDVSKPNGSEIQPYPNYSWHSSYGKDCNGLTSVYRVQIDNCGQMWILDSGEIDFEQHCPPQLVVIDLQTDRLVHRYQLPRKMYKKSVSRFVTPLVDIADPGPSGRCRQAMVYMADPTGNAIIVYDMRQEQSWRIENKYTYPDPDFGTHTIAGESFELMDGVLGLTITPRGIGLRRLLFFHALSNDMHVALPLDVANNASNWNQGISSALSEFMPVGRRGVQCGASAMTAHGILLCGFYDPIGIVGWNIRTPYTRNNRLLLAENPTTLQFVSGAKVIKSPSGKDELWVVSNRLQRVFSGSIKYTEINYRIQRCGVDELLTGKQCR